MIPERKLDRGHKTCCAGNRHHTIDFSFRSNTCLTTTGKKARIRGEDRRIVVRAFSRNSGSSSAMVARRSSLLIIRLNHRRNSLKNFAMRMVAETSDAQIVPCIQWNGNQVVCHNAIELVLSTAGEDDTFPYSTQISPPEVGL